MNRLKVRFWSFQLPLLVSGLACGAGAAEAHGFSHRGHGHDPSMVSVEVERPEGGSFMNAWYDGAWYVAGVPGERYAVRVTNLTGERVEAVVSVDGRDVVTGALADYKRHRGYVIEPYGSVLIDGFRQSWQSVAAFRFGHVADSYSARRGTPQHVGVIGVAVFREHVQSRPQPRPIQPIPYSGSGHRYAPEGEQAAPNDADAAAPSAKAEARRGAPPSAAGRGSSGSRSRAPARVQTLGTEYGETRYSAAREVTFRRNRSRRPDQFVTAYYDSPQSLWARGIPLGEPHHPYWVDPSEPEPWPSARSFAPPPPRW